MENDISTGKITTLKTDDDDHSSLFIENILSNDLSNMTDSENRELCRKVIKFCNENTLSPSSILKMVSFIELHFLDNRMSFNDRGAFLSTAVFKKDDFNIQEKTTYFEFEDLLPTPKKKNDDINLKYGCYKRVYNEYQSEGNENFCIQNIIKILNTTETTTSNYSKVTTMIQNRIHENFENIMSKVPNRIFDAFYEKLFHILIEIRTGEIPKFKSLSYLIKEGLKRGNFNILEMALDKFKETKSDVLRTFLVYSFDILDDILTEENRVKIHLRFAETVLKNEILNKIDGISKKAVMEFLEKGMKRYEITDRHKKG